jgi:hypothetical protein
MSAGPGGGPRAKTPPGMFGTGGPQATI